MLNTSSKLKQEYNCARRKLLIDNAFTLMELLMVIAIISILATLLLPALNKAKGSAQAINCTSSLKQMSTGTFLYSNDYADYMPLAQTSSNIYWLKSIHPYLFAGNALDLTRNLPALFFCVSNSSNCYVITGDIKLGNYGYNDHLGIPGSGTYYMPRKRSSAKSPSRYFMLSDNNSSGTNIALSISPDDYTNALKYLAIPHSKRTNMAYVDGHADKFAVSPGYNYKVSSYFYPTW